MECLEVLEKLVLGRHFMVVLEVVDNLTEVVGEPVEVDLARDWCPPEVEMGLLRILHLCPEVRARLVHHPPHQLLIVPAKDLVLKEAASLRLRQEMILY